MGSVGEELRISGSKSCQSLIAIPYLRVFKAFDLELLPHQFFEVEGPYIAEFDVHLVAAEHEQLIEIDNSSGAGARGGSRLFQPVVG